MTKFYCLCYNIYGDKDEFNNWKEINEGRININKGIKNSIKLKLGEYDLKNYPIKKGTEDKIYLNFKCNSNIIAPVHKEDKIGKVTVYYDNHIILEVQILADENIKKKGIIDYILEVGQNYAYYLERVI